MVVRMMQHHTLFTSLHQGLRFALVALIAGVVEERSEADRDRVREQGSVLTN
jgi:hypothetical protein